MDPLILGIVVLIGVLIVLMSGIWIAIGLGLLALIVTFILQTGIQLTSYIPWTTANSFIMTAIPLFIFMGELLLRSGASDMIYSGTSKWLGWAPGGLLHSNIGACTMFAAISGSSSATAATIGTVAIPSLKKRGYDLRLTLGSLAAGGTLGTLIPPSITMIVFGAMGQVSVSRCFAGGVVPGLMWSLMFMGYIGIRAIRNPKLAPKGVAFSFKGLLISFTELWPVIVLMGLVLGGIFSGFVTPTEAAALGVSGALLIGLGKRQLTWRSLQESLVNAVVTACMVIFIIMGANMLGSVLALAGTAKALALFVSNLTLHPIIVMFIISLVYIMLGCVMEGLSIVVITTPIVLPAVVALGFDPVWFGVALVMLMEMGLLTPPVGVNLFVIQGISGASLNDVVKGAMPFFLIQVIGFIPVIFFPSIILWLPRLIFGS